MAKSISSYEDLPFKFINMQPRGRDFRVECSECSNWESLGVHNMGATLANERLPKLAGRKGWLIGKKPKDHLCPTCRSTKKEAAQPKPKTAEIHQMPKPKPIAEAFQNLAARPPAGTGNAIIQHSQEQKPMSDAMTDTRSQPDTVPTPTHPPMRADKPAKMEREDRRAISSKLDDVYINETLGYDKGWTDKRVANDLGVPQAWVAEVREYAFGPEFSAAMNDLIDDSKSTLKAIEGLRGELALQLDAMREDFSKRIRVLEEKATTLRQQLRDVEAKR